MSPKINSNFDTQFTLSTLAQSPHLRAETLDLIERSFHYSSAHSFAIDFAPLMSEDNAHHNYIVLDKMFNRVVGHIGILYRSFGVLNLAHAPVVLMGGIAVDQAYRGQGLFSFFFDRILSLHAPSCAFFLLWSDQVSLYRKFSFDLCFGQHEYSVSGNLSKCRAMDFTKLSNLLPTEQQQLQRLYDNKIAGLYVSIQRNESIWSQLYAITSADLYLERSAPDGQITNYFIAHKGQDLRGVLHETTCFESSLLPSIGSAQIEKIYLPESENPHAGTTTTYMVLLRLGDWALFSAWIASLTQGKIKLIAQDDRKCIHFTFEQTRYEAATLFEFLAMLWGPHPLAQWRELVPRVYISGLDSI